MTNFLGPLSELSFGKELMDFPITSAAVPGESCQLAVVDSNKTSESPCFNGEIILQIQLSYA